MGEFLNGSTLSPFSVRLTVGFFFLLLPYTPAKGEPQVTGSLQPIMAAPGDNVILPCHVKPLINVEGLTVEWSRPDRKPDPRDRLSRVEYVHLYRDKCEVPDMKMPSYVSRTELFTDELRQGNISLKIFNVTLADVGRYKCFIPKLKSTRQFSIVHLVIEPNYNKSSTTEMPLNPRNLQTLAPKEVAEIGADRWSNGSRLTLVGVVCILLILSVGVTGYRLIKKRQK